MIDRNQFLTALHAVLMQRYIDNKTPPTHILIDPRTFRELMNIGDPFGPLNFKDRTAFGLSFIEVYKPYPFVAVVALEEFSI